MNLPRDHLTRAVLITLGSVFVLSSMMAFSKLASPYYTPIEVAFWRNLIALIPVAILIFSRRGLHIPPMGKPGAMVARSVLGTLAIVLSFTAYAQLPMADVNAITMSSALLIMVLAHFFLDETMTRARATAVMVGLIGVIIVLQPSGAFAPLGTLCAVGSAFTASIMRLFLRHLGKTEDALTVTFYFLLIGTFVLALPLPFIGRIPDMAHFWLLLVVGGCGALGQFLNTLSYKYGEASFISVLAYSQLLFMIPYDYFLWSHAPALTTLVGGGVIIASNVYIVMTERKMVKDSAGQ